MIAANPTALVNRDSVIVIPKSRATEHSDQKKEQIGWIHKLSSIESRVDEVQ